MGLLRISFVLCKNATSYIKRCLDCDLLCVTLMSAPDTPRSGDLDSRPSVLFRATKVLLP
jgi:hypothetical protein